MLRPTFTHADELELECVWLLQPPFAASVRVLLVLHRRCDAEMKLVRLPRRCCSPWLHMRIHHCRVLQQRFDALEVTPPDTPSLRLSEVAAGLSRREAARLFYQICSTYLPPTCLLSAWLAKDSLPRMYHIRI